MTLLFDQNLSHRLIAALHDLFPGALHVRLIGMAEADDFAIWEYAKAHNLVIVTQAHYLLCEQGDQRKALVDQFRLRRRHWNDHDAHPGVARSDG